jgi:23S rRNA pseudouridine1911/1915/1917 synthase
MKIEILYEDDDILAVNKPSGLVVHSDGKTVEPNLSDWVLQKYPESKNVGEPARTASGEDVPRPGIVHRLDRETSGVILLAKTEKGFQVLKKQFQEHEVKKTYEAFVFGEIPGRVSGVKYLDGKNTKETAKEIKKENNRGIIDRPIGRSANDFRKWSAQRGARGEMREAVTEYEVKARANGYSLVEVFPKTGRTHQIRVHFKAINYPLVADKLYAIGKENTLGFERLALHSRQIEFKNTKGKNISVVAPYPLDFEKAIAKIASKYICPRA